MRSDDGIYIYPIFKWFAVVDMIKLLFGIEEPFSYTVWAGQGKNIFMLIYPESDFFGYLIFISHLKIFFPKFFQQKIFLFSYQSYYYV